MTSKEITEYQAYFELTQFGDIQQDYRFGLLASMYANAHRKKGAKAFKPSDFFPSLFVPEDEKREVLATKISNAFSQLQRKREPARVKNGNTDRRIAR
jgi:hypothetical protein